MIERSEKKRILAVCTLFTFLFYGLGFRINYQPDIYGRVMSVSSDLWHPINFDGRIVNMVILYVLNHLSLTLFYYVSLMIAMVLITIATYRFTVFLLSEFFKIYNTRYNALQIIMVSLLSCVTVANLFSVEFFQYIDTSVAFVLCILCCVISAIRYVTKMQDDRFRADPVIFVCLLVVAFSYEPLAALFIILTVPFIMFYSASFTDFLKKQVIAGLYYGVPLLIKTVYTKFGIHSERSGFDKKNLTETVQVSLPEGITPKVFILDRITFGMWIYAALSLLLIVLILVYVIKKQRYIEIVKGAYISCVTVIGGILPFILRLTNDYKPRVYYPLGAFWGVIFIYGILIKAFDPGELFVKQTGWILGCTLVLFTASQWLSFAQMYADCYITNYEDKYISQMIGACIDRYEKETGNKVDKVVFYEDEIRTKYCTDGWCLTQRVYSAWFEKEALALYTGRTYEQGQPDAELAQYFHDNNWDVFTDDLVVIKGDTAHICKY